MIFKVYGNRVVYGNMRYFIANAQNVGMGTYGTKRTPIHKANYLDSAGRIDDTPYEESEPFGAQFSSSFKLEHIGAMNLPLKAFNLGIDDMTTYDVLRGGRCVFRNRRIDSHDMMRILNRRPALKDILKMDNDYRIVTSVIWLESCVIAEGKLHNVDVDGDFDLGIGGDTTTKAKTKGSKRPDSGKAGLKIEIAGEDSMSTDRRLVFEYGANSIMAYALHKPIWDRAAKNKREDIVDMKPDWQGLD